MNKELVSKIIVYIASQKVHHFKQPMRDECLKFVSEIFA